MQNNWTLNDIILPARAIEDPESVVGLIKKSGIAVFPNFLSSSEKENLINDYEKALNDPELFIQPEKGVPEGYGSVVKAKTVKPKGFNHFKKFFYSRKFKKISEQFWGSNSFDHCHDIYVMKDIVGTRTYAHDLHFDITHQLKFYLYLNDVTSENGAMEVVPGSQEWTQNFKKNYLGQITVNERSVTRDLPYDEGSVVPLEAKAGSLIVFDTDMFHRAGCVTKGERWVARGHTCKKPKKTSPIFNPFKMGLRVPKE